MENILHYLCDNPVISALVVLSAAIFIYFFIIKILKYAIISLVVFMVLAGYSYYKAPDEFPDKLKSNISEMSDRSGELAEKGKNALEKGKDAVEIIDRLIEKGRELIADNPDKR